MSCSFPLMDTKRQTEGRILWFTLCQPAQWYKSSWRNTVMTHLPLHQGLPLTEVQLESFWHGGDASPALQHLLVMPGRRQPCEVPVSAETSMVSCKVWHFLTSAGTFFKSKVNGDKLATWSYDVGNWNEKKEQGQPFGFQDRFGGILHETREEKNKCSYFFTESRACYLMSLLSSPFLLPPALWLTAPIRLP